MRLATIAPNAPFLDTLARRWRARSGASAGGGGLADGLILLPTRRAARSLAEAFLRANDGAPQLLPRITAIGGLDEAPLTLAGALDLAPAVDPLRRLAVLSRWIMAMPPEAGGARSADAAWRLASELADLIDEAARADLDLASALGRAADTGHAEHWQATLRFLEIVTRAWPDWLAAERLDDPAARQAKLLRAQAQAWETSPPNAPVWIAGTTGAIPAVASLLRVVARMPGGQVVLPGLDRDLSDAAWDALDATHPQAGLRSLLTSIGARRDEVEPWEADGPRVAASRARTLSTALLPAAALSSWRERPGLDLAGVERLAATDAQEEAVAIALVLREAIETPGAVAALVTPDRALAARVTHELLRWGVIADDSAGEPLAETPPAVLLRLLARAVASDLGPVDLLGLLKHPLAGAGLAPAVCRAATRALEMAALRGPRPPGGLAGLRRLTEHAPAPVRGLLDRVETSLAPALRLAATPLAPPAERLRATIEAAEALATTDEQDGASRLWGQEEGEALATHLAAALDAVETLPDGTPRELPGLLDALLAGAVVRSRRALRGRDETAEHPRVFIWGLLEARLQSADVVILGGLVEGVWPPATEPGPWMSRPMRVRAGLPSPEERIGQTAHDFVMAACAAPRVVLSCPRRRDNAPAVPARWLVRLDALAGALSGGSGGALRSPHPAQIWAGRLDRPNGPPRPVRPPEPRPPVHRRPRKLSVTEIETLIADPYAIHARHVMRLRPLDPLEQETDAADYGSLVHAGLHHFLRDAGVLWPAEARARLREAMERALEEAYLRRALVEWWRPRLVRIADWIADHERDRRALVAPVRIGAEIMGEWALPNAEGFRLTGRADRIEMRPDGTLALLDYKTGTPPSARQVADGHAPQLPLEAAMAAAGAFGAQWRGTAAELAYWHLTGGFVAGEAIQLLKDDGAAIAQAAATAAERLAELVASFDDPDRAYLAQPHPGRRPRFPAYAQLARVAEWSAAEDE